MPECGVWYRKELKSKLQNTRIELITEVQMKIKFLSDVTFQSVELP